MTLAMLDNEIAVMLDSMTLTEKIGQLTMVCGGVGDLGGGSGGALRPELSETQLEDVRAGRVGSILNVWGETYVEKAQAAARVSRLRIPLLTCLDVLHGYETLFPIPLGEAASFDPNLWEATARAAAVETASAGVDLTFAPMLDVARDARWGRMAESFGEDPWLGVQFATAKVRGYQRDFASGDTIAATAKHLGAYGAVTAGREYNSVDISTRSLHEVHLPPFAAAVRAGVAAIMPSFNDLAGVPMTANAPVLRGILRERYGFDGVIISDFSATAELLAHGVAADLAEAAALSLKAGIDIDMVSDVYPRGLPLALKQGLVNEGLIDEAVRRVLALKARLGLLADLSRGRKAMARSVHPIEHRSLAREAACKSMVLLQNRGGLLPLRGEGGKLAILGPFGIGRHDMMGPWRAAGRAEDVVDFVTGLRDGAPGWSIDAALGCFVRDEDPATFPAAMEAANRADLILLCLGESADMSGEAGSRAFPGIPAVQQRLAEAVFGLGKPVIVALSSGRPLTAPWLFEKADAVIATWFPGCEAGPALADVLTGRFNPSGKLPVCWPYAVGQMPIFYAHRPTGRPVEEGNHMTSRYIDVPVEPQFPFGHGLSYTSFAYRNLQLSREVLRPGETLTAEVEVLNQGKAGGQETAFLFMRDPIASVARPVLELKGVARLSLPAGGSGVARFSFAAEDAAFIDEAGHPVMEGGVIELLIGPKADRAALIGARIVIQIG
jgi:beta-glucosidase